jgi:hypothetical protein
MHIDIHNHPTVKPFGQTCKLLLKKKLQIIPQNLNYDYLKTHHPEILKKLSKSYRKWSIWKYDRPHFFLNKLFAELAFAKYSQSNFTSAIKGNTRLLFVSLYPIEKEYMTKTWDEKIFGLPLFKNFVTGISSQRIKFIQSEKYKYFNDLNCEYEYLQTLSHLPASKGKKYFIARNFNQIDSTLKEENKNTIGVVLTIEGSNILYPSKYINDSDLPEVLKNIETIKHWPHKVLWIGLTHHFYNGFVSHEKSLIGEVTFLGNIDQKEGMNKPLSEIPEFTYYTENGLKIIDSFLSTDNGPRILIDMKHSDFRARKQYYRLIKNKYNNTVPVVLSHAAAGGNSPGMPAYFNPWTLNLNDDDIYALCATKGITGIEFDQRLLGFKELKKYKRQHHIHFCRLSKKFSVELVWNSIRYIAEKAAAYKFAEPDLPVSNPWEIIAIGSDFDGIINPVNQFPTLVYMSELKQALQGKIEIYLNDLSCDPYVKSLTTSTPTQIADQIFHDNAYKFLERNFV